ncbi:MAG: nuclear transport factor 2 family protein [Polyangiaceae bacterium]
MRRPLVTLAFFFTPLMAAACSGSTPATAPPAPIDWKAFQARPAATAAAKVLTNKERAVAEGYEGALSSPGFTKLSPMLDEDVRATFPGQDDAHGRDAVMHAHEVLFGAFDGRVVGMTRVFRTDSTQAVEWSLSGTQSKDWLSVAATRKPVVIRGLTLLWTKDDGSLTDIHIYFDVAVAKAQLGVGPKELLALPAPKMPSGPPQVYEQTGSPDEKVSVTVGRAAIDALEANDEAGYVDTKTDDTEYYTLERAQPEVGKEAARAYFRGIRKAIAQLDTTIDNAWGIGNYSVLEYSIAGEQTAPIGWIPLQRSNVVHLDVAQVNEDRGGKVARVWRYDNPLQIVSGP